VAVRSQGWGKVLPSERRVLAVPAGLLSLVREVELQCEREPWVFARTLIPATSLRGTARRLALLRDKPLGAVLFSDPHTRRLGVQVARLNARHRLYHAACAHLAQQPNEIWGRRTLFSFGGKPLLVNEIFLPTIAAYRS
jgi:chorismate--pyruvate lyase